MMTEFKVNTQIFKLLKLGILQMQLLKTLGVSAIPSLFGSTYNKQ